MATLNSQRLTSLAVSLAYRLVRLPTLVMCIVSVYHVYSLTTNLYHANQYSD